MTADDLTGCAALRIETARLRLRLPRSDDAGWIERLLGDREVARFTARIPHPYPAGEAASYLASMGDPNEPSFAIERREDGEPIGVPGARALSTWTMVPRCERPLTRGVGCSQRRIGREAEARMAV